MISHEEAAICSTQHCQFTYVDEIQVRRDRRQQLALVRRVLRALDSHHRDILEQQEQLKARKHNDSISSVFAIAGRAPSL
jgi:hypothetical protein